MKIQLPELYSYNWKEAPTPYFTGSNLKEDPTPCVLWLQPEGGYDPLIYYPISENIQLPYVLWNKLKGIYNPLSLPRRSSLKYKCRLNLSLPMIMSLPLSPIHQDITINMSLIYHHHPVIITVTSTCHCHCHINMPLPLILNIMKPNPLT
jgi:hypothetical protein